MRLRKRIVPPRPSLAGRAWAGDFNEPRQVDGRQNFGGKRTEKGQHFCVYRKIWAIARGRLDRNSTNPLGESTMTDEKETKERILIAEDDPVSRRVLETLLKKWGYEVVGANDGLEAARLMESREAPRLAVLDWMMPGLEGVQVCQRIRQDATRPYMYLLLTARSQRDDLVRGLESGAGDYLTKPFDAQELRARLNVGKRILDLQDNLIAAREKLLYQATHDALTGISNRGVSLDALRRERSRQTRENVSFATILLDIDHFKYVNDTYGHPAGDAVLMEAAQRIKSCIRPYDYFGTPRRRGVLDCASNS
jgi:PleD family two-component response regulator